MARTATRTKAPEATQTYAGLQAQIAELQEQAAKIYEAEVQVIVAQIREAISHYGLTAQDLGLGGSAAGKARRVSAKSGKQAKYRSPEGQTWGGRGPHPKWLREALAAGHQLSEFIA